MEQRVDTLLIHGILHLVGYDHEKNEEEAVLMEDMEKRLAALITDINTLTGSTGLTG